MGILDKAKSIFGLKSPTHSALRQIHIAAIELQQKKFISRPWVADQISQEVSKKAGSEFIRLVEKAEKLASVNDVRSRLSLSAKTVNDLGRFLVREGYVSYGVPLKPLVDDESLFFPFVNKVVTGDHRVSDSNFKEIRSLQGLYDALYFTSGGSIERRILGLVTDRKIYSRADRGDLDIRSIAFEIYRQKNGSQDAYIRSGVFSGLKNMTLILLGGGNTRNFLNERRVADHISEDLYTDIYATEGDALNVVSLQSGLDGAEFDGTFQFKNRGGKVAFFRREQSSLPITKADLIRLGFYESTDLTISERDAVERLRKTLSSDESFHYATIKLPHSRRTM